MRRRLDQDIAVRDRLLACLEERVACSPCSLRWYGAWLTGLRAGEAVTVPGYLLAEVAPGLRFGFELYTVDAAGEIACVA